MNIFVCLGVREATHGPHLHAVDVAAVGATAEAVAAAGVTGMITFVLSPFGFYQFFVLVLLVVLFSITQLCSNIPFLISAGQDPYLDLLGEVAAVMIGDQGALATAGAPCALPLHLQRSAAPLLMEAGALGVPAPGVRAHHPRTMVSAMAQNVVTALEVWRRRTAGAEAGAHLMATAVLRPMVVAQALGMTIAQALGVTAAQAPRAMVTMTRRVSLLHPEEASPHENLPSQFVMLIVA